MGERLMILKYTAVLHTGLLFSKPESICMCLLCVYIDMHDIIVSE